MPKYDRLVGACGSVSQELERLNDTLGRLSAVLIEDQPPVDAALRKAMISHTRATLSLVNEMRGMFSEVNALLAVAA